MSSELRVNKLTSRSGVGTVTFNDSGLIITGIATATTLDITGNATIAGVLSYDDVTNIDSVGIITAQNDVVIADKIIHLGDTNTAIRFPAADTVTVETGGSERVRIDSSGRMGLGTQSPDGSLHVHAGSSGTVTANGNANDLVVENSGSGGISILTPDANHGYLIFGSPASNEGAILRYRDNDNIFTIGTEDADGQLQFRTGAGQERMRIDNIGNVGVGLIPGVKFDIDVTNSALRVKSDTSDAQILVTSDDNANAVINFGDESDNDRGSITYDNPNNALIFQANAQERVRIDSSGNMGLGTSSPDRILTVSNTSGDGTLARFIGPTNNLFIDNDRSGIIDIFSTGTGDSLAFGTQDTERLRIDSSGNMGLGTASPSFSNGSGLEIERDGISTLRIEDSSGLGAVVEIFADDGVKSAIYDSRGNASNHGHEFRVNGSPKVNIDSSGRLLVGTSSNTYNNAKLQVAGSNSTSYISMLNTSASDADGMGYSILAFRRRQSGGEESTSAYIVSTHDGTGDDEKGRLVFSTNDGNDVNAPTERMRLDSSGRLLVGTTSASKNADRLSGNKLALVDVGSSRYPSVIVTGYADGNADGGPLIEMQKSRGASDGSMNVVADNDRLGNLQFLGSDGTNFIRAAEIKGMVDGTPGTNDMPGRLVFTTTADGASSPTERMRIDSSGRLLVGTTSASSHSDARHAFIQTFGNNSGNFQGGRITIGRAEFSSNITSGEILGDLYFTDAQSGCYAKIEAISDGTAGTNDFPGRLVFSTTADGASSSTERMRIGHTGNVLFYNTTNYVAPFTDNAVTSGASGRRWSQVWAANGTIQTSDERLKTEITTSALATDFVKSLRPVSYKWIEGGNRHTGEYDEDNNFVYETVAGARTHWGFIAQEVKQSADDAGVDFGGWVLEDKDDADSTQSLRYDQFIAPLTAALQEAIAKIETLEAEVAALKAG